MKFIFIKIIRPFIVFIFSLILSCKKEDDSYLNTVSLRPFVLPQAFQKFQANSTERVNKGNELDRSIDTSIDSDVVNSIYHYEGKKQYYYRLGDVYRVSEENNQIKRNEYYHLEKFPDSIAAEYIRRTHFCYQEDILLNICLEKTEPQHIPPPNALVIHLRIGDVIDGPGDIYSSKAHKVEEYLTSSIDDLYEQYKHTYVKPLSYYQDIINIIKDRYYTLNKIILIGGFHTPLKSHKKSLQYVSAVKRFFMSAGFDVSTRIDYPADDDFLFMTNASFFTPSGGGFSETIRRMVELTHGEVISP